MKKILITTTAAILLVGCGNKPATDTTAQSTPSSVDQSAAQSAAPTNAEMRQTGQEPQIRQGSRERQDQYQYARSRRDGRDGDLQPVVSIYLDPPLEEPTPVMVEWAPPPMLVDIPPPPPSDDAVWTGGYWVWQGDWVWAHGRWAPPPRQGYHWNNPYYEHRGNGVVFVDGYWRAPESTFVAPSPTMNIALAVVALGVIAGQRPDGPSGVFVPPPPGSHRGLIVPAPLGTAPAVVVGAPPIVRVGMHIEINNNNSSHTSNVSNVANITNVTVVAPANATATGRAVNVSVPAQAHLAAAQTPLVNVAAPKPVSANPIPTYVVGHAPVALPPPQIVHSAAALVPNAPKAAPTITAAPGTPTLVSHAPPEAHPVAASQQPIRKSIPDAAAPVTHNDNQIHPQPNVAPVLNVEKRSPPPAGEAKPAQMEKQHPASIVQPVIAEKHSLPPTAKVAPAPDQRAGPMPQKQTAPAPSAAPKAIPAKPEQKEGNTRDKEKREAN